MNYTANPTKHAEFARELIARIDGGNFAEHPADAIAQLRSELSALADAPPATWEGGSLQASLSVYGATRTLVVDYCETVARNRRRAAQAAHLASTYEVVASSGTKWKKTPERIAKTDAAWSRAGCVLVEEPMDVRAVGSFDRDPGDGHPSGGYSIRSHAVGAELAVGKVAAKRLLRRPAAEGGSVVQYLVRPYSRADQARRARASRIAEIRYQLGANLDYQTAETIAALHRELATLGQES